MIFRKGIRKELQISMMTVLTKAEEISGVQFEITSGFRKGDDGAHGDGYAVDIACVHSKMRWKIVTALIQAGFHRIGIYDRHIHADRCYKRTGNVIWWGVSK